MKEIRLPKEFSFVHHTEAAGKESQSTERYPRLTDKGRQQAVLLGQVALLDNISGRTTVRLVAAPGPSKETATRAYGGPTWTDYELGDPSSHRAERSVQIHHSAAETSQFAVPALRAVARLQSNFQSEIHPVAFTSEAPMLAVREYMGIEEDGTVPPDIEAGTIDTYKLEDNAVLLRTVPLGQAPEEGAFLVIPRHTTDGKG